MCIKVTAGAWCPRNKSPSAYTSHLENNFITLRPTQNGRHFPDDIFECTFWINLIISIMIPMKFVPKGPIDNIRALVHIMCWNRSGDKPLPEIMMVSLLMHICITRPQIVKPYSAETRDELVYTLMPNFFSSSVNQPCWRIATTMSRYLKYNY